MNMFSKVLFRRKIIMTDNRIVKVNDYTNVGSGISIHISILFNQLVDVHDMYSNMNNNLLYKR